MVRAKNVQRIAIIARLINAQCALEAISITKMLENVSNAKLITANDVRLVSYALSVSLVIISINKQVNVRSKFIRCKGDCLRCDDESEQCLECPINRFTLQQQVLVHSTKSQDLFAGILGLFFGIALPQPKIDVTEIKLMNKCLKKCPKVYGEAKTPVIIHEAERKCIVKESDNHSIPQSLPAINDDNDINKYIAKLKMTYDEAIKTTEKNSMAAERPGESKECHFNGLIRREIKGDLDSYYICRCDEGYMGDNCQIPKTLYNDIQSKIAKILTTIKTKFAKLDNKNRNMLLDILISINKFKVNRPTIEQLIAIIQTFVKADKQLENKKKLYLLYDSLLLNLFDLHEDVRKRPAEESLYIKDLDDEIDAIYNDINHILIMLEDSLEDLEFANSFLDKNSRHYIGLETYSYILAEYRYSNYNKNEGFLIANPNIDTSFNNVNNNFIYLTFKDDNVDEASRYNLQILNIASPLFIHKIKLNRKVNSTKQTLVSNIVYLKNIDPKSPHVKIRMVEIGVKMLTVKFSLNFVPIDLQKQHLSCVGYSVSPGMLNLDGECISFDDDAEEAVCEFELTGEVENYYFGLEANV